MCNKWDKQRKNRFFGVGKTSQELRYAIKSQIKQINIESEEELEDILRICKSLKKKIHIGLRINPNVDAKTHNKISTGRSEDKFGIPQTKILGFLKNIKIINL